MDVKLYGFWLSPYCTMVHAALKLKGVAYEYIEEDLRNKSETFLKLNPVHQKVPVLVVDGKPLAESFVILQYIDEMWKEPPLIPEDPYLKARVRFWADFIYQKVLPASFAIVGSNGEALENAAKEFVKYLNTLEEGIKEDFSSGSGPFLYGSELPGLLDIIIGSCSVGVQALQKIIKIELMNKGSLTKLQSSIAEFGNLELLKSTSLPYEAMLELIQAQREAILTSTGK